MGVLEPAAALPDWSQRWWLPVRLGLGGLLSGALVFTLAPEAEGHGTDAAVGAYHRHGGQVRTRTPFITGIASALTIGSGGVFAPTVTVGAILGVVGLLLHQILSPFCFVPASFVVVSMAAPCRAS